MKEVVIAFLLALSVGAILNGMNFKFQPLQDDQGATQPGLRGQELIFETDESTFQGYVLDSKDPVLVEFYTDNCPGCQQVAPVLGTLALEGQGKVTICKVNIKNSQTLAARYNVSGAPTFILFKDGHMTDTNVGAMNDHEMRGWLATNQIRIPTASSSN
ncbi:MAG: thioredoxin family protein [Candidatus Obscuribacterales bacterium]|nr:thioredoxin family protein [Candidatus Obscuribacterales bacterium]